MRRNRLLLAGIVIVGLFLFASVFAPLICPHDPTEAVGEERLVAPSLRFPMGTDQLRRDVFSRVLHGGRVPMTVAVVSSAVSMVIGSLTGLVSGFVGGRVDRTLSLLMDAVYSFPSLILAIAVVAMLGPGLANMILAISFVYVPTYFRVARGQTLQLREEQYVEAARAAGASGPRVLFLHIAPNAVASILAVSSFSIADGILTEAALAFLGFGLPPPIPDWGFDIQNGQKFLQSGYWWLITFPGLMIITLALGFALVGEGTSDLINPLRRPAREAACHPPEGGRGRAER